MLVITGTQRSGTSFTAKFFKECRFNIGSNFWHDDINGGLENIQVCSFFKKYIGDMDFPFSDIPEYEFKNLKDIDFDVIKFSYMMMIPVFPYIWNKFRGSDDTFLILKRDPTAVAKSRKRVSRFNTDSFLLEQDPIHIYHNFEQSLKIFSMLGFRYEVLEFPAMLYDFKTFSETVNKLGINISDKEMIWNRLVDFDKVHFPVLNSVPPVLY